MNSKPLCYAVGGARGSGKTTWCVQTLNGLRLPRLAIFDFKHDTRIDEVTGVTKYTDLATMARAMKAPTFRARYLVDHSRDLQQQFHFFNQVCWTASRLMMYVPELPMVTTASRPPPSWRQCVNVGREYTAPDGTPGWLAIMVDFQRCNEVDKAILNNADVLHTGRQAEEPDARDMARRMGGDVTFQELMFLPDLHWIERQQGTLAPTRGVLTFGGNGAKKKSAAPARRLKRAP